MRLNLGSGERLLHSEKGIQLNDLVWHTVDLNHTHHNISMIVDRTSRTNLQMPGPDLELSVEDGLLVGGTAELNHPYLRNITTGFRGCMDEFVFNDHDLLSNLKQKSGYKRIHEVSMGCSPQFSATEEDPVNFFSSKAFILLPRWEVLQEGTFECELYTSTKEENGMVLYSSGSEGEFVAIEIRDGHLVASVGNGRESKTELHSLTRVHSNQSWYTIQLHLLPHSVQLKVGKELVKASLSQELQGVQLHGAFILGGLNADALENAGLPFVPLKGRGEGSFKGCLRNIRVNSQKTGLPHAIVTKDITVGCSIGQAPKTVIILNPTDPPEFDPTATQDVSQTVLLIRTLEVAEGGQALLEPKHLKVKLFNVLLVCVLDLSCALFDIYFCLQVSLDFRKLGISPSQLVFRIEEHPVHGQLRLNLGPNPDRLPDEKQEINITVGAEEKDWTFSLLDLKQGRVMYVHSGSEGTSDSFTFSVFSSNKKELPMFRKDNHLHRFDISISPVNDAPVLSLPQGNIFTLLEKSKRKVCVAEYVNDAIFLNVIFVLINEFTLISVDNRCAECVRPRQQF